jgi:ACS family hexuronate transporter-like MFS transporter
MTLRWWISGLLLLATCISYIDRQTMAVAAPAVAREFGLSDQQIGHILSSFLLAYAFGQLVAGRVLDWTGSRWGLSLSIAVWSLANLCTAWVTRPWGLTFFRFLLGLGESGNYPGGVKVIAEWFPPRERALGGAIFASGASAGAVLAAPLVATITHHWGWRAAFLATGALGFLWLAVWLVVYRTPDRHPFLSPRERALLSEAKLTETETTALRWQDLLRHRQVWTMTLARFLEEPLLWLSVFWLPKYLVDARGLSLLEMGYVLMIPYLTLDAGYLLGGWLTGRWVRRGLPLAESKQRVLWCAAACMLGLAPAALVSSAAAAVAGISLATLGHGAWFSNVMTIPADLAPRPLVASFYGITALGGSLGGILFTELTGFVAGRWHTYAPTLIIAGIQPLLATLAFRLVRGSLTRLEAPARLGAER